MPIVSLLSFLLVMLGVNYILDILRAEFFQTDKNLWIIVLFISFFFVSIVSYFNGKGMTKVRLFNVGISSVCFALIGYFSSVLAINILVQADKLTSTYIDYAAYADLIGYAVANTIILSSIFFVRTKAKKVGSADSTFYDDKLAKKLDESVSKPAEQAS